MPLPSTHRAQTGLAQAQRFFVAQAGYRFDPLTETPLQSRRRGAKRLAHAEHIASTSGCSFTWSEDPDLDSTSFIDPADGIAYPLWQCLARREDGSVFASLGGIDFGPGGSPYRAPYRRVVEAELACEL